MTPAELSLLLASKLEPIPRPPFNEMSIFSPQGWWLYSPGRHSWEPVSHREPDRVVWMLKRLLALEDYEVFVASDEIECSVKCETPEEQSRNRLKQSFMISLKLHDLEDAIAQALLKTLGGEEERG